MQVEATTVGLQLYCYKDGYSHKNKVVVLISLIQNSWIVVTIQLDKTSPHSLNPAPPLREHVAYLLSGLKVQTSDHTYKLA